MVAVSAAIFCALAFIVLGYMFVFETKLAKDDTLNKAFDINAAPTTDVQSPLVLSDGSPNQKFLNAVRSRSCYPVLRGAHGFLTAAAVIATGIMWLVLMNNAGGGEARIYATLTCGGVIVTLLIEYGLFRLIVDAVDVLIDTGRRAAGQQADATAGAGG